MIPASVVPSVVITAPPAGTATTEITVRSAGNVSTIVAPVTSDGPLLVTVIV